MDLPFVIGAERSRLHAGLFAGDVVVIVLVLSAGMLRHGQNPLASPEHAALVVWPFLASWLVVSYVLGAYTGDARRSTIDATENAAGTWLVAALVGAILRSFELRVGGTDYLPGESPLVFVAVVVAVGAVGLSLWRGGVTEVVGPAER